jgi:TRAP transporter TAXI family solute receptor
MRTAIMPRGWRGVLTLCAAAALLMAALAARPPRELTVETGPEGGSYYNSAVKYRALMEARGITLRIRVNPNSLQIINDVANPQSGVDIGFIAQDVSEAAGKPVVSIGQIEMQPLFVYARAELGRRTVLNDLRGRRIVMPPSDSATSEAARRVFALYDITPENTQFAYMPIADAARALRENRFDAGAFMLAPDNAIIQELMFASELHLVPIGEVRAIANQLPFLRPVTLPRGIYSIADAVPQASVTLVAASVGVVARQGVDPSLIYALLEVMAEVHGGPSILAASGDFPSIVGSQFPVSPIVRQYYLAGLPWTHQVLSPWAASLVDSWQVLIFCMLLFAAACVCIRTLADGLEMLRPWRGEAPTAERKEEGE